MKPTSPSTSSIWSALGRARRVAVRGVVATAFLLGLGTAVSAATGLEPVAAAQEAEGDSAGAHFDAGVALFRDGDFMAAMIEFKKAYELDPNFHVLYNLGQTSRELRQYAQSLDWFRQYLEQGGDAISEARRTEVTEAIGELEGRVGTIEVKVSVAGAEVAVDDIVVGTSPLAKAVLMSAGRRKITVSKAGFAPLTRFIDVAGRESKTLDLELVSLTQPEPVPSAPVVPTGTPASNGAKADEGFSALPFVLLGTTAAVGIAAGVVGGLALSAKSDFDAALETYPSTLDTIDAARSDARTMALTADVLAGVAGALGVATIVVFIVEATGGEGGAADTASLRLTAAPGGLGLSGSF